MIFLSKGFHVLFVVVSCVARLFGCALRALGGARQDCAGVSAQVLQPGLLQSL